MNEEQKQALIGLCKIEIRRWEAAAEAVPDKKYMVELMKIALADLTAQPVKVDESMALAFHKALNDGGVGHEDLEEIKVGLEAALSNNPRPAPAADLADLVPKEMPPSVTKGLVWRSEKEDGLECYHMENLKRAYGTIRAAILRNTEEAKK